MGKRNSKNYDIQYTTQIEQHELDFDTWTTEVTADHCNYNWGTVMGDM